MSYYTRGFKMTRVKQIIFLIASDSDKTDDENQAVHDSEELSEAIFHCEDILNDVLPEGYKAKASFE